LEAEVTLLVHDPQLRAACEAHQQALAEAFVVSSVRVGGNGAGAPEGPAAPGLAGVAVARAPGRKCGRCWKHLTSVGEHAAHPSLCARCARVVTAT
jgi:isoleucyl-tRNA synthetase